MEQKPSCHRNSSKWIIVSSQSKGGGTYRAKDGNQLTKYFFWRFKPKLASLNFAKPSGKELVESGQTDFLGLCRLCLSLAGSLYSVSISLVHRRIKGGTLQVYQHHINIQDASPPQSRGYCYHQLHLLLFDRLALITVSCAVTMKWAFLECNVSLYNKCL